MAGAADAIVVGGGIVGVATAGELARRGARVTLLEARDLGVGATQASAGMLAPFTEATPGSVLSALCAEGLDVYDAAVARARRDSGLDFEYARTGTLEVALDAVTAAHFAATAAALAAQGVDAELRDGPATLAREPAITQRATASLFIAPHGFVAVSAFTVALAAAARRYGVDIVGDAEVSRIARRAGVLEVSTSRSSFTAPHVVLAAGCWSGRIALDDGDHPIAPPIRPIRGQLLELMATDARLARIVWGPRCYLVPWRTGAVLVGATVEDVGFDTRTTVEGVRGLIDAATELIPGLASAAFTGVRVGLRPASPDGLPILGESDIPGLVFATGHYRNGVLLAPLTAGIVADLVLEGRRHRHLDALSPARFTAGARA
jgi:glycine oxidase